MRVPHTDGDGTMQRIPPCLTLLLANLCGKAGRAGGGSKLGTSQGLPVLGTLVGNVKSVCILILWALVCSFINGEEGNYFYGYLLLSLAFHFIVALSFFSF